MKLPIKCLSYTKIGSLAEEFLLKYHPILSLPIPIEEIIEQKLRIKIIQQMGLKRDFDVDGFSVTDFSVIFIDFDIYMKYENRTRFTLAHEIGHLVLHKDLIQKLVINSTEKLHSFNKSLSDEDYGWLEYQAYSFASHVLVPSRLLFNQLKSKLGRIPNNEAPEVLAPVAADLLDVFKVSDSVILGRLQKEGIIKSNN